jgi:phage terminase large subunit
MKAQIKLPPKLVPVFQGSSRYRGAFGGRGSAKTRSFALMTAVWGYKAGRAGISGNILCAREHLANLDDSSMEEVKQAIRSVDWLDEYYEIGEKFIRSKDGRIKYLFSGLRHNIGGVKSKARLLLAWVDEAEQVGEVAWRTLLPTVREDGSEVWVTWNPESEHSSTNTRFRINPPSDSKIIELNWQDNPWFPKELDAERLEDMRNRPDTYDHVWEGAYLVLSDALIFKDRFYIEEFEPTQDFAGPYFGCDFGFANDPNAATESYIHDRTLYIRREAGGKLKQKLDNLPHELTSKLPRVAMHTLRCDSARPETIAYLNNHGFPRAVSAKKGKGSVEDGIEHIKSYDRVVIHPDCPETAREFRLYSYKIDRLSGDILPIPVDEYNHFIDSLRYALEPVMRLKSRPRLRAL